MTYRKISEFDVNDFYDFQSIFQFNVIDWNALDYLLTELCTPFLPPRTDFFMTECNSMCEIDHYKGVSLVLYSRTS